MMKYMMMSEMMKGNTNGNNMMPVIMMMNGGMGDMFEEMFDFNDDDESEEA